MLRRKEEINNNNRNLIHSYGRLRRKIKNYDLNNFHNDNHLSNNINDNNYSNKQQRNSNYILKDNHTINSRPRDIYTSYQYKLKNKNNSNDYNTYNDYDYKDNNNNSNINNNINDNINNNINNNYYYNNKKIKPIVRPSKSAIPNKRNCVHNHYKNNESASKDKNNFLLCQNCINERLIEEKRRKNELSKKSSIPDVFEDKYKNYSENLIREKVLQREKNIKEIYNNLEKWNELNDKDRLIRENENSINPLYQDNHNYLYEKFRKNYENKQKLIKDNFNKFQNNERPEITDYFINYVNNPKYKGIDYGEYKPKIYDIDNYRKDLDEQINYRNNKIKKEKEEDKKRENLNYNSEMKSIEIEKREKEMKKKKMKEELIKGNLELIKTKKQRKEKLNEEDLKYRDIYNKENIEYKNDLLRQKNRQQKLNKEFLMENQKNLGRIKRRKEEQMMEDEKYRYNDYSYEPPKEITAECSNCHKIYPKKLLTSNAYFYRDFRK